MRTHQFLLKNIPLKLCFPLYCWAAAAFCQSCLSICVTLWDQNAQDTLTLNIMPLFYVSANSLHITAYFMKRWVNLRCALGKHYRGKKSVSYRITQQRKKGNITKILSDFGLLNRNFFQSLGFFLVCFFQRRFPGKRKVFLEIRWIFFFFFKLNFKFVYALPQGNQLSHTKFWK